MRGILVKVEGQDGERVLIQHLHSYEETIPQVLEALGLPSLLKGRRRIVIKPNLVLNSPPPVTTDVRCVEAIARFCLDNARTEVVVAEGSGGTATRSCFDGLGYTEMARRLGIRLVDLDADNTCRVYSEKAAIYKSFPLPETLLDSFVISVPVLKEHSITDVTLSLKNMIGICPAKEFSGYWTFKKSRVHRHDIDKVIIDINLHCPIGLALVDGGIGMKGSHLGGREVNPPIRKIVAGIDPVAVDAAAAALLGHRWDRVRHLKLADGVLGRTRVDV